MALRHLTSFVLAAVFVAAASAGYGQEEDDWGEIVGLMNGLTGANQQLLEAGVQSLPTGRGGLTPGFLEGLHGWAQAYARVLQSVDGAFDVGGYRQPGFVDPFDAATPDPLWEAFNRWQTGVGSQNGSAIPNQQYYRSYRGQPLYRGYQRLR